MLVDLTLFLRVSLVPRGTATRGLRSPMTETLLAQRTHGRVLFPGPTAENYLRVNF